MPATLPERASLDWLKKTAKQNLRALRAVDPGAKLADAQLALARDYGFASWRALKAHIERPVAEEVAAQFLRAVGDGEADKVHAALAATPALANAVGPHPYWGGRPQPLHVAIETRRRDMFDLLLAAGAEVNGRNEAYDHWSPLMLTFAHGGTEMREELLHHGARVGLVEALLLKDDALVDVLLRGGLPAIPNDGSILAFARTPHAIDRLLALDASPTQKDRWGTAPIEAMSRVGGDDGRALVRHMMGRGVVPAPQDFARLGDQEVLAVLADADPSIPRSDAVMMAAVDFRHHALVRWLLAQGGSPNAVSGTEFRHSALHSAAWNGDLEMVQLLVAAGADVHARDARYDAPPWGWATTAITVTNNPKCREVADWLAERAPPG